MDVKFRKKTKYFALSLLFALFFVTVSVSAATYFGKRGENSVPFSQKIVVNVKDKAQHSVETDETSVGNVVNVMLQYAETFTCAHAQISTEEELESHRAELKAHYLSRNADIVGGLDLSDCSDVSYSWYGPFIEYRYDSAEDFFASDFAVLESADSSALEKVYVESCDFSDDAERNGSRNWYPFTDALKDIGVSDKQFTGNGVKIGIVESGVPNNYVNLSGVTYETYGTTLTSHSFHTSSVMAANTGIANDAELYFAALSNNSFVSCCNWFISKGVNVINRSNGGGTGTYNSTSAYADYVVKETKMTFVNSAGNDGATNLSGYPGTGLNVISVASSDWNKGISDYSSAGMQASETISLANPTLTAPGGSLCYIPNISGAISGTSFSAPMVTGVVALLMEEFPQLKYNPQAVMALLSNTCNPALGQTDIWDRDAGFGIVNYERARKYFGNVVFYDVHDTAPAGSMVGRHYINLPLGGTVNADTSLLVNSNQTGTGSLLAVNYTKLRLDVMDNATGNIVATGNTLSNLSYVSFTNEGNADGTFSSSFSLCVYLASAKTESKPELYSIHYVTDGTSGSATLSVGIFRNGGYVYGNNFVSSAVIDTGVTFTVNDVIKIQSYSNTSVGCNFGLGNDIIVTLGNFAKGENRIELYNSTGLRVELIIRVAVPAPVLSAGNIVYSNGASVRTAAATYISWSLASETSSATAKITSSGGYNKTLNCKYSDGYTLSGESGKTVTYTVILTDDFGTACTFFIIIDMEAPAVRIYTSGNPVKNYGKINTPFYVTYDRTDATAFYRLNGGASVSYGSNVILSTDGTYEFRFTDSVGNVTERTVYLDMTAPGLTLGLCHHGASEKTQTTVPNSWSDFESTFVTCFSLDGLTDSDPLSRAEVRYRGVTRSFTASQLPATFTAGGQYSVSVSDSFGNGYSFNMNVLGSEPVIAFSTDGATLKISVTHDQPFEHIEVIEIYRDGKLLEGASAEVTEYTFKAQGYYTVIMSDNAGRVIEKNYSFATVVPAGDLVGVTNGGRAARSVSFIYNPASFGVEVKMNGKAVTVTEIGAVNLHADGKYEIKLFYKSNADVFKLYSFEIDKTAPLIIAEGRTYTSSAAITFEDCNGLQTDGYCFKDFSITSLTDAGGYCAVEISADGEISRYFGGYDIPAISEGGIYTLTVYDALGNGYSFNVRIAGAEPKIRFEVNANKTAFGVDISFENSFVNAVSLQILKDGKALDGISADVHSYTFAQDGEYTVALTDDAGRQITKKFTFVKTVPKGVVAGVEQQGKTKGSVSFKYDKSVFKAEVYLNGSLMISDNAVTGEINLERHGSYLVRLSYITDPTSHVDYEFEIDKLAPGILLDGCAEGKTVSGNVRVGWQDTDVASATYRLNGGIEKILSNACEFTADGIYTVTLTDDVDNVSTATFGIDKTAPEVFATAWVYGESAQRQIKIESSNSCGISNLFCTGFEISQIVDGLSASYIEIMFNESLSRYAGGNSVPAFDAAGVYNVLVYDNLNNMYMFSVNVIGGAPQVTFSESENRTSFTVSVIVDVRDDLVSRIEVYRNGAYWDGDISALFEKDGEYKVIVHELFGRVSEGVFSFEKPLPAGELEGVENGGITNAAVRLAFGDSFAAEISKDGGRLTVSEDGTVDFTADGEYTVRLYYKSDAESYREYTFVIDTVCPKLQLSGIEDGGSGRQPVVIAEIEDGATLEIYKDGELIEYELGAEIKDAGEYEVRLTDAAGNASVYTFTIESFPIAQVVLVFVGSAVAVTAVCGVISAIVVLVRKKKYNV